MGRHALVADGGGVNYPVEGLCRLLMDETERGCPHGRPYFEYLGAALVVAIASQTDPRLPDAGNLQAQHRRLQLAIALMEVLNRFHQNHNLTSWNSPLMSAKRILNHI